MGKKVELVVRDDESNPAKGAIAARELVQREKVAALFGGLDTPVSLAIVPFANQNKVPFMGVWAAGTPITRNGAVGELRVPCLGGGRIGGQGAGRLLNRKHQVKKPGMILINNPWGEIEREGSQGRARRQEHPLCRHREVRELTTSTWFRS